MERHRLEAELGQEHFCPPAERFRWGNFPPGGIEAIVITYNPLIFGRPVFINIFNSTISSQNPSSSLVFNLCTETSYWYLWVTSSVDYIS
jgi:hypothetical protein